MPVTAARQRRFGVSSGILEKDYTLRISKELEKQLKKGAPVRYS